MAARMKRRGRVLAAGAAIAVAASLLGAFAAGAATSPAQRAAGSVATGTSAGASATTTDTAVRVSSAPVTVGAAKARTTTAVRASPAAVTVGGSVTLAVTVRSATGQPTGTVTFTAGSAQLCRARLSGGAARCTARITTAGRVTVTGRYGGDASHAASSGSANVTVARAGSALAVAVSPQIVPLDGTGVLSAQVTSRFGVPSGTVTFADGKGVLCAARLAKGAATCRRAFTAIGTYRITARYGGDAAHLGSAASAKLIVAQGETATAVSVSAAAAQAGAATTFSAAVKTADGTPTGSVVFAIGAAELCSGTLVGGTARCTASYPTPGTYTVTATYAGDDSYYGSFGSLSWTVTKIATTLTVAASPAAVPEGAPATLTAQLGPATATGTVTFTEGGTALCAAVPVADGSATCVTAGQTALGAGQVTAAYPGTALYEPASAGLTLTVVPSVTSIQACVNVGTVGKRGTVGVTLTLVTPGGDTTARDVGTGAVWYPRGSNCPGGFFRGQPWTLTFGQPVAAAELASPASYLQVTSTAGSAWHGQFELFTGSGRDLQQILLTRANMYYNQQSPADPCGNDASVSGYQFPLTTTPPGTCGTPTP